MVLITGPDLLAMQEAALTLFDAGHIPLIGEWFASPMVALPACGAGYDDVFQPLAERLLLRADAVLRLEGALTRVRLRRPRGSQSGAAGLLQDRRRAGGVNSRQHADASRPSSQRGRCGGRVSPATGLRADGCLIPDAGRRHGLSRAHLL